jgi:small-conductance mechanosensitive channel
VSLAEILVSAPVRSAYLAAFLFAGAQFLMMLTAVALHSQAARRLRCVQAQGPWFASRCRMVIRWAVLVLWSLVSLNMIGVLRNLMAAGEAFLELRWKVGAAEISIQGITIFLTVFLAGVAFSRTLRFVLTEEVLPRIRLPRGAPGAIDLLSRYGILLLGFFIALAAAGVDLSKVTLIVSAVGVGIGFGLQNVVNNFVSGLILVFEHPVQVGDLVEVGSVSGEVRKIGFRASVLRTADGADVIIPNGELVGAKFINWSLSDRLRRIAISVNVSNGTDPKRVIDILLGVARNHSAVLSAPEPLAVFDRFADSALNFTLLCWCIVDDFFLTRSELTIAVNNAFHEAGIQIPFPQQDVHIHWPGGPGVAAEPSEPFSDVAQSKPAEAALRPSRKGFLAEK